MVDIHIKYQVGSYEAWSSYMRQMYELYVYTTFFSPTPSQQRLAYVLRQMALPTCGRETKEHQECHESETSSRCAFLLIQSVYFTQTSSRTNAWADNMG